MILPMVLVSCASGGNAILKTLQNAWGGNVDVSLGKLNPAFRYLRLVVDGQVVLLALGYTDRHPLGPIETWYSANKEVLRIQNGRIIGASGTVTEWQSVSIPPLPTWLTLSKASEPFRWTRSRDLMPGYRYGVKDPLISRVVPPPVRSQLLGVDPASLVWFEEDFDSAVQLPISTGGGDRLPTARYAVSLGQGNEVVVYAEQCLAIDLCFSWQRWLGSSSAGNKK